MSKSGEPMDESVLIPTTGKWIWKEDPTNPDKPPCLEFASNYASTDKQDKNRRRGKGGGMQVQDFMGGKRNDRATPSIASRPYAVGRGKAIQSSRSPKPSKPSAVHTEVTLTDVKLVAMDLLQQDMLILSEKNGKDQDISDNFDNEKYGLLWSEAFDDFLMYLLNYFHCYFEKKNQEEKKNPNYIEPSLSEKKAYEEACQKLQVAQKHLGQSYCVLILGLDMQFQHHMACGSSRVSTTRTDRVLYENLYNFCIFFTWVAFRRKDLNSIKVELGRMLRSDTFNPAIRVKYAPDSVEPSADDSDKEKKTPEEEKKLTPAEYRRLHPKRPAIKSIINQRSPALVSILPSPNEEANWLFRRQRPLSPKTLGSIGKEETDELEEDFVSFSKANFKMGIIGEPFSNFNHLTLTPLGAENDEENEAEEGRESQVGSAGQDKASQPDAGSRMGTAMSQATTEAPDDD
ncbi:protein phosphatase 1 regulatory subunit 36 [Lingula anatina]|uniref:Protein phosphatase 1 regulatory subunit 36 n=1 Tax=Lingula anatina TaxID=7574 RepID=A0A1S3JHG5_LINAN|nr:protein phosphatase 1 regulatory subunit 36 [Lingula anatina]|eukprot:XP_013409842.1 protein phosphatase 1 regulatory subunit 36 [Lingula anatina]